jgi:hypothetical protein
MDSLLDLDNTVKFIKNDIASVPEADLVMKNNTSSTVVFKIKTTDPNKYVVKPNQGVVTPNGSLIVKITTQKASMQKMKNDRFLVVAGAVQEGDAVPTKQADLDAFWGNLSYIKAK